MNTSPDELLAEPIRRALWRMKWSALRPLQAASIPLLLHGSDHLILSARTAAGKTEAAFLPILSSICDAPFGSIRAIYVGPLKALINDQFRRLEELCEYAEIPVHRWHGDVSGDKKRKMIAQPGGVLLITPESLESLLLNRSNALAKIFHSLSFVVIDELHALLGKERGTQLRSQLYRIEQYSVVPPRLVALSATIGDLKAAARWMSPEDPEGVRLVEDKGNEKGVRYLINGYRKISQKVPNSTESSLVPPQSFYQDLYDHFRGSKNLIFANAKATVEDVTDALNEMGRRNSTGEEFLIHHGSLSKEVREETEALMQGERAFTTICSSTLELGIDIGNIKTVGQIGPCWSVSSLVQRLGRSGRKDEESHQMRVFVLEDPVDTRSTLEQRLHLDLLQSVALTELMLRRWVESPRTSPRDFSTLVQQTLSTIAEHGGITAISLFGQLVLNGAFRFLDQPRFATFLRGLAEHDLIEQHPDGSLILGLEGEQIVRHYDFYAAFQSPPEFRVVNDGRVIGRLSADLVPRPDDHFLLGGRRWQVISVDMERAEVSVQRARGRKVPLYPPSEGDIAREVRQEMRTVLRSEQVPLYLDQAARRLLTDARREASNVGLTASDVVQTGDQHRVWFPWTSSAGMRTLDLMFEWGSVPAELRGFQIAFDVSGLESEVHASVTRLLESPPSVVELSRLVADPQRRKWDRFVPLDLLAESFAVDCLDLETATQSLKDFVRTLDSC